LDILFGCSLLSYWTEERSAAETLAVSALVGIYFETLLAATLLFLGLDVTSAGIAVAGLMFVSIAAELYGGKLHLGLPVMERPRWYEWLLLISIGEKLLFAGWQLVNTRTY